MVPIKCSIFVKAGVLVGQEIPELTREWNFTPMDLDNPPDYIDRTGSAMNYAMSLQNPSKVNWVSFEWIWY
ncbi:MAG: hypothetical protein KAR20_24770 [Candidatus Heimdallarchaeota archaeon]|nr:hypothetical protein [Candidatus Heimdallarchaeota archaeon]